VGAASGRDGNGAESVSGWPSERAYAALVCATQDPAAVRRYRAKVRVLPGSACLWWIGAVSGRGHGRFWLGTVEERDVVVIAHRFAFALAYGPETLLSARVLGHRCDNPLCQRAGTGHVEQSSAAENRREWAARRLVNGSALRDARGARGRALELREVARRGCGGWDEVVRAGVARDGQQLSLWPTPSPGET
jgi:hypothetical protein